MWMVTLCVSSLTTDGCCQLCHSLFTRLLHGDLCLYHCPTDLSWSGNVHCCSAKGPSACSDPLFLWLKACRLFWPTVPLAKDLSVCSSLIHLSCGVLCTSHQWHCLNLLFTFRLALSEHCHYSWVIYGRDVALFCNGAIKYSQARGRSCCIILHVV